MFSVSELNDQIAQCDALILGAKEGKANLTRLDKKVDQEALRGLDELIDQTTCRKSLLLSKVKQVEQKESKSLSESSISSCESEDFADQIEKIDSGICMDSPEQPLLSIDIPEERDAIIPKPNQVRFSMF